MTYFVSIEIDPMIWEYLQNCLRLNRKEIMYETYMQSFTAQGSRTTVSGVTW